MIDFGTCLWYKYTVSSTDVVKVRNVVMAARGRKFLKRLGRLGLLLLVAGYILMCILTSIPLQKVPGISSVPGISHIPGIGSGQSAPPSADQRLMEQATATTAGQDLKSKGFTAKSVIDNRDMISWLNQQEQHQKVNNPGPYVLFSAATRQADKPDPKIAPDVLVDAANGLMVALSQAYSDDRGAVCYNASKIENLGGPWVSINTYLWHKSLDDPYDVTHDDLPQLPKSLGKVHCYTFQP